MNSSDISQLKNRLIEAKKADPAKMRGADDDDITQLKKLTINGFLPSYYVEFLKTMGADTGGEYLQDFTYRAKSITITNNVAKIIAEQDKITIPDDVFFFAEISGSQFYFFQTGDKNDNPPVFLFAEKKLPEEITPTLSDFLEGLIDFEADLIILLGYEWDTVKGEGFFAKIEQGIFDQEGFNRTKELLEAVEIKDETINRRLVELLWFMPTFLHWRHVDWVHDKKDTAQLDEAISFFEQRLTTILGLP